MKFYTTMPKALKSFFEIELADAKKNFDEGNLNVSWHHLERAHIFGQPYPWQHTLVHWRMLVFGIRIKNFREIVGQIPRLLVGGVKSFVGRIPVGNTGGADVPPLQPMEIPGDLQAIIQKSL